MFPNKPIYRVVLLSLGGLVCALGLALVIVLARPSAPAMHAAEVARLEKERAQSALIAAGVVGTVSGFQAWRASRREKAAQEGGR